MPDLSVAESIFLAHEPRRGPLLDLGQMYEESAALLARFGHDAIPPRAKVGRLRPAAQQIVSIARALSGEMRLLIMDEPSAILDEAEIGTLFEVVQPAHRRGRRRDLHHAPPRRDPAHRRQRHGTRRRADGRNRPSCVDGDRRAGRADGRPQGRTALSRTPHRHRHRAPGCAQRRGGFPPSVASASRSRQARSSGSAGWSAPDGPSSSAWSTGSTRSMRARFCSRGAACAPVTHGRRSAAAWASRPRTASRRRSFSTGARRRTSRSPTSAASRASCSTSGRSVEPPASS